MTRVQVAHDRQAAALTWVLIFGGSVLAIVALHTIGSSPQYSVPWSDLWRWLDGPPDRVLLGLGRVVALGMAYYVVGSMLLYTAARATKVPGLIRSAEWLTLPAIRRVSERAVAVSLTVSTLGGVGATPVMAQSDNGPVPTPVTQHVTDTSVDVPLPFVGASESTPEEDPPATTPTFAEDDAPVVPPPFLTRTRDSVVEPARGFVDPAPADLGLDRGSHGDKSSAVAYDYVVVDGDNMWVLAQRHLQDVIGRAPSEAETATYWSHMIDVNRPHIRSGNPDLIFPGEVVVCPPVNEAGL